MKLDVDGIFTLRNAIVLRACEDYRKALHRKDEAKRLDIENFFHSEYFDILCPNIDGDTILEELRTQENKMRKGKVRHGL